jgi:two-component SAPR family response regulator
VKNLSIVQSLESSDNLNEHVPDLLLLDVGLSLLIVADFLENVSVVGIFHYQAARKLIVRP